jgi:plasmid maintenance system antidote protein VapI
MSFGQLLGIELHKIDRTKTWLARQIGVTQGAVSQIVHGSTLPSAQTYRRIVAIFPSLQDADLRRAA